MRQVDFRSSLQVFARSGRGSAQIALALFAVALTSTVVMGGLHLAGIMQVPQLILLVFTAATCFAGWDAFKEWRKARSGR